MLFLFFSSQKTAHFTGLTSTLFNLFCVLSEVNLVKPFFILRLWYVLCTSDLSFSFAYLLALVLLELLALALFFLIVFIKRFFRKNSKIIIQILESDKYPLIAYHLASTNKKNGSKNYWCLFYFVVCLECFYARIPQSSNIVKL